MTIVHIVLIQFKPTTELAVIEERCRAMLALSSQCVKPDSGASYIKSVTGGRSNSPDGLQVGGMSHAFVAEFESEEDRIYYLEKDPAHLNFTEKTIPHVQRIMVVDYTPGVI